MNDFEKFDAAFSYDAETGLFVWKIERSHQVKPGDIAGTAHPGGYWYLSLNNRRYLAHRVAFLLMTGRWPSDQIDHINGIRNDNSWCNLREATNRQNLVNHKVHRNGRLQGAQYHKRNKNWNCQIQIEGKILYLGTFKTEIEAHTCYVRAYYAACEIDNINKGILHVRSN